MSSGNYKPLDVDLIRQAIKEMSAKHKLAVPDDHSEAFFTIALALSAAVKKMFHEKSDLKFTSEPVVERKVIVQFKRRMRIDALEKFNNATVFSTVHFYRDATALVAHESPVAVIVVFVEKDFIPEMLRLLKYPYVDDENETEVKDGCGAIVNLIAGQFKKELITLGYKDLEMSPFESYVNTVVDGIDYPFEQLYKYEIDFDVDGRKRMAVEMVMGNVFST